MNIRQSCIFSFEDAMKMQPKSRLEKIIDTLDLKPVLTKLNKPGEIKAGPKTIPGLRHVKCLDCNATGEYEYFYQTG